jgi:hypothetical protein
MSVVCYCGRRGIRHARTKNPSQANSHIFVDAIDPELTIFRNDTIVLGIELKFGIRSLPQELRQADHDHRQMLGLDKIGVVPDTIQCESHLVRASDLDSTAYMHIPETLKVCPRWDWPESIEEISAVRPMIPA